MQIITVSTEHLRTLDVVYENLQIKGRKGSSINSKVISDAKLEGREAIEILGLGKAFIYTLPYWIFVGSLLTPRNQRKSE